MSRRTRQNASLGAVDATTVYARKVISGNALVRSMVTAAPMSTPPTFSISTTSTLGRNVGAYWSSLRWSGCPWYAGSGGSSRYVRDAAHLDLTVSPSSAVGAFEFDHTGLAFEFRNVILNSGQYFRVWVDGVPHTAIPVNTMTLPGTPTSGTNYWIKATFATRARRRIRVEMEGSLRLSGLAVGITDMISPPSIPSPRFMVIGDSYGAGFSATYKAFSYPFILGRLLGWTDIWAQAAVPSTGVVKTAGNYGNYASRLPIDVVPYAPDVLLYQGSLNDGASWPLYQGQIATQLRTDLAYLKAALPNTLVIVTSPLFNRTTTAAYLAVRDEMAPVCAAAGVPFIDVLVDSLTVAGGSAAYFTGSGSVATPAGDGNADVYRLVSSDDHLNDAGHIELANILAGKIAPYVGQTATA